MSTIVVATAAICDPQSADGNRLADIVDYLAELGAVYIYMVAKLTEAEQKAFASLPLPGTKLLSRSASPYRAEDSLLSASLSGLAAAVPARLMQICESSAQDPLHASTYAKPTRISRSSETSCFVSMFPSFPSAACGRRRDS